MKKSFIIIALLVSVFITGCGAESKKSAEADKKEVADNLEVNIDEEDEKEVTEENEEVAQEVASGTENPVPQQPTAPAKEEDKKPVQTQPKQETKPQTQQTQPSQPKQNPQPTQPTQPVQTPAPQPQPQPQPQPETPKEQPKPTVPFPAYGTAVTSMPEAVNGVWGWQSGTITYVWGKDEYGYWWQRNYVGAVTDIDAWDKQALAVFPEPPRDGSHDGEAVKKTIWVWLQK